MSGSHALRPQRQTFSLVCQNPTTRFHEKLQILSQYISIITDLLNTNSGRDRARVGRLTGMGLMLVDDQKMGEKVSTPTDGEGLAPTHHLGTSHKSQTVSCALDFVYNLVSMVYLMPRCMSYFNVYI